MEQKEGDQTQMIDHEKVGLDFWLRKSSIRKNRDPLSNWGVDSVFSNKM